VTWGVNISGHDTNLALTWLNDTWAVGSNETGLALALKQRLHSDHIKSGDTLSDAYDEFNL
jgi:hypothetical protein